MRCAWLIVVGLAACGGDEKFACSVMTASAAQCTEYSVPSSKTEDVSATCAAEGGAASPPCADKGSLGVCSDLSSNGISYQVWVYPSSGVPDVGTAQAYCTALKGKWTVTKS
jgi:hypothetical protein